jgi:hypothetical protein
MPLRRRLVRPEPRGGYTHTHTRPGACGPDGHRPGRIAHDLAPLDRALAGRSSLHQRCLFPPAEQPHNRRRLSFPTAPRGNVAPV